MLHSRRIIARGLIVLLAILFELMPAYQPAAAQSLAGSTTSAALNEATVKALQEALNKQGISVSVSGVLNDETRAALKKFQSQHHLPVTGDPDKATLDKLGVEIAATPKASGTVAQATPPSPQQPQTNMMNCPMMQNQMANMMQTMQTMMEMMKSMQGMMSGGMPGGMPGQMQPGQMQPGQMQPGSR